jgi:hypothetical protein
MKEITDLVNGITLRDTRLVWHQEQGNHDVLSYLLPLQAKDLVAVHEAGLVGTFDKFYAKYCKIKDVYDRECI